MVQSYQLIIFTLGFTEVMKMKKSICLLLSLVLALMMSVSLTGCGGEDESAAVKETVDGCLTAMQDGDFEKVKEYCDDEVFKSGSLSSYSQFDELAKTLTESIGIDEADLSDEVKESIEKFKADFLDKLIDSYEIGDITIDDDGKATANATVTYGLDVEKLKNVDFSDMGEGEKMVTDYINKNQSEFMKIYQNEGEKAALTKLVNDIMPQLMDLLADKMYTAAEGTTEEETVFTLEKNDDGNWLIKSMDAKI